MPERFIDEAWIKGDFKKATISASQSALTDSIWFIKYPFSLYAKFKPQKPSISFFAGTKVHNYFQQILQKKIKIEDVQKDFNKSLTEIDLNEKEKAKANFIKERIVRYVQNHINALIEISDNANLDTWKCELFFSEWYDEKYFNKQLGIETELYVDCASEFLRKQSEHKNRFGSVYKYKDKKGNETWKWRKSQKIKSPQFTHCIQEAVYIKSLPNYKPHLVYADEENYTIFNQDNCYELSPEGLKYFFNKYIQINVRRQEMLRMADGDIKKLAMMIGIDWSEIRNRENNPILNTIQ